MAPSTASAAWSSPAAPRRGWAGRQGRHGAAPAGRCSTWRSTRSSTPTRSWWSRRAPCTDRRPVTFVREDPPRGGPVAGLLAGLDALLGRRRRGGVLAVDMPLRDACTRSTGCATAAAGTTGRSCVDARRASPAGRRARRGAASPACATGPGGRARDAAAPAARAAATWPRCRPSGDEALDIDSWADLRDLRAADRRCRPLQRARRTLPGASRSDELAREPPRLDRRAVRRARRRDRGRRGPDPRPRPARRRTTSEDRPRRSRPTCWATPPAPRRRPDDGRAAGRPGPGAGRGLGPTRRRRRPRRRRR